jgi:hypothetical protein
MDAPKEEPLTSRGEKLSDLRKKAWRWYWGDLIADLLEQKDKENADSSTKRV